MAKMKSITRRTLFAVPVAAALPASAPWPTYADDGLIDLVDELAKAVKLRDEAETSLCRLEDECEKRQPAKPSALQWRPGDPVGHSAENLANGKCRLWCSPTALEEHRSEPISRVELSEALEQIDSRAPENGLWKLVPDEKGQRRFDEILHAHDEHQAAVQAVRNELGLDAAEERASNASQHAHDLAEKIASMRAYTVRGLQAKVRAYCYLDWHSDVPAFLQEDGDVTKSIVRDLRAM